MNIEFPKKLLEVYNDACRPLCKKLNLPQTAFDILMFLGNNPQYQTARDIVKVRNIKANLVSINVEKLVQEGYLIRQEVKGDRRKTRLICTKETQDIIKKDRHCKMNLSSVFFEIRHMKKKRTFGKSWMLWIKI